MAQNENVLNPLSGVASGDAVNITARKQSGGDAKITYDPDASEWQIRDGSALGALSQGSVSVGPSGNGFRWSYDSNAEELVFSDPDGIELMRHPKAGSTQFLQGIDVAFPFTAPEDGLTNFVNANNTSSTSSGTTVGYTFSIDNQTIAQVSADSDGSGGIGDGKFIVRQAGGTAGTDEGQFYHDDSRQYIESKSGDVRLVDGDGQYVQLNRSGTGFEPSSSSVSLGTSSGSVWGSLYTESPVRDSNDADLLSFTSVSSAVNNVDIANAATGNAPTISAVGSDADISLALDYKGAGAVRLASNNTADTSGDVLVRDDSGGDLFSLDNGGSPQIAAKYEGTNAFTFGRRTGNVGDNSLVVNGSSISANEASGQSSFAGGSGAVASGSFRAFAWSGEASGTDSVAFGPNVHASGKNSFAAGNGTFNEVDAAGENSVRFGKNNKSNAENSSSFGTNNITDTHNGFSLGTFSETTGDNQVTTVSGLSNSSRIFAVGVGGDGGGTLDTFDGRGRVDGLYVTMRDGTYARHGLQVDGWNGSAYERRSELLSDGSLFLSGAVTKGTTNLVASDYTTVATDYYIGVDTTTGAHTVTVRSADIEDGREIVIHDQGGNASGNNVTVQTEGSETISGAQYGSGLASITMDTDNESVTLRGAVDNQSTGETNLYVV